MPAPSNDQSISGGDECYRRIPPSQAPYDSNRGRRWPSSASMMPSPGDTEVSVYLGSVMAENDLQSDDLLEGHERHGLMRFPVQAARDAGFGVLRDPVLDTSRPLKADPAHALLTGEPSGKTACTKRGRRLVRDPRVTVIRDPDVPQDHERVPGSAF